MTWRFADPSIDGPSLKERIEAMPTFPIIYKMIPVQFAFLVSKDGMVQINPVSDVPKKMKFESEKKARKFISNYKEQL